MFVHCDVLNGSRMIRHREKCILFFPYLLLIEICTRTMCSNSYGIFFVGFGEVLKDY